MQWRQPALALFMRTLRLPPSQAMRDAGMKLRSQHIVSRMMASAWNIAPTCMSWISSSRRCVVMWAFWSFPRWAVDISWYQLQLVYCMGSALCVFCSIYWLRCVSGECWENVMLPNDQGLEVSFDFWTDGQMVQHSFCRLVSLCSLLLHIYACWLWNLASRHRDRDHPNTESHGMFWVEILAGNGHPTPRATLTLTRCYERVTKVKCKDMFSYCQYISYHRCFKSLKLLNCQVGLHKTAGNQIFTHTTASEFLLFAKASCDLEQL